MDLISVIVPVYNVAPYIEDCLKCILNQTYENIEIILVDDGSTDGSGDICDSFSKKDVRIRVCHQKNSGVSVARNTGVSIAKGEYIAFIDSDDCVAPNLLEYLYQLIKRHSVDIGICGHVHCFNRNEISFREESEQKIYDKEDAIVELLYQKSFLTSLWGKIFPRSYFEDIRFPEGMIFEDSAVVYKLFDKATKIAYGNAGIYAYIHREKSITTKIFSKSDCDILPICEDMEAYFANRSDALKKASMAYHGASAFRIYMNAPKGQGFDDQINNATTFLNQNCKILLKDKNIRRKMKVALLLYRYARPFMTIAYRMINRWK